MAGEDGWSWGLVLAIAGGWTVLSFLFALLVARLIRMGQRPDAEEERPRRRASGVVARLDQSSPAWDEVACQLEREREVASAEARRTPGDRERASGQ